MLGGIEVGRPNYNYGGTSNRSRNLVIDRGRLDVGACRAVCDPR
jgi:hypothetical protein